MRPTAGMTSPSTAPPPQRASYRQVILPFRLREAIQRLTPCIPTAAR
jgi:type I restriction enzyme, R subunit